MYIERSAVYRGVAGLIKELDIPANEIDLNQMYNIDRDINRDRNDDLEHNNGRKEVVKPNQEGIFSIRTNN